MEEGRPARKGGGEKLDALLRSQRANARRFVPESDTAPFRRHVLVRVDFVRLVRF